MIGLQVELAQVDQVAEQLRAAEDSERVVAQVQQLQIHQAEEAAVAHNRHRAVVEIQRLHAGAAQEDLAG